MRLIPEAPPLRTGALPDAAAFWMPRPDEIDEEGFGYFRASSGTCNQVSGSAGWDLRRCRNLCSDSPGR